MEKSKNVLTNAERGKADTEILNLETKTLFTSENPSTFNPDFLNHVQLISI